MKRLLVIIGLLSLPVLAQEVIFKDGFENHDPVIVSLPVTTASLGNPYSYDVDAEDIDGDTLQYQLTTAPAGMAIDPVTGLIEWMPGIGGIFNVAVEVADGGGGFAQQGWSITVSEGPDSDGDGLSDFREALYGTDPHDPDTDDDGLSDGDEVFVYDTDPLQADSDADGLSDGAEVNTHGTDPRDLDTDGDGFGDGLEIAVGTNPLDGNDYPTGPVDPAAMAPDHEPGASAPMFDSTSFLWNGNPPIQTGVSEGAISPERIVVLRGKVMDQAGDPLPGVTVSILQHSEFGQTLSRVDGRFDLAANGGGLMTIEYRLDGYLPAQRQVEAPWRDYVLAPDVALLPLDPNVTELDLTAGSMGVARGSVINDGDGTRQATVLSPVGTAAELVFPDGTIQPISTLNVRATEYTVGDMGPMAMPAMLPPTSAYTYAVELSADEALAAGASDVVFSQPLPFYVENFLGFPVGTAVPTAYYDSEQVRWVPSKDGLVLGIVSEVDAMAAVDTDGDGVADSGQALVNLGITDAERENLAALYDPGQSLWRVPIGHFTPWDHNWPYGPPDDAERPRASARSDPSSVGSDGCNGEGSIIACQDQVLGERLFIPGTSLSLNYRSDRVPGRTANREVRITASHGTVPASLKRIEVDYSVAGRQFSEHLPALPNQALTFLWDGKDAYGRQLGSAQLTGEVAFIYDAEYRAAAAEFEASFGSTGSGVIIGDRTRQEIRIPAPISTTLGGWDARGYGLGGWTLDILHAYDVQRHKLHFGNGVTVASAAIGAVLDRVVPRNDDEEYDSAYGGIGVGPDGSVYFVKSTGRGVYRKTPDGEYVRELGCNPFLHDPCEPIGDGAKADEANLVTPDTHPLIIDNVAIGPAGELYAAGVCFILKVDVGGFVRLLAGELVPDHGCTNEGRIRSFDIAPDGSILVVHADGVCRRIGPDGIIRRFAGTGGAHGYSGDGGEAINAQFRVLEDVAIGPDGTVYLADRWNFRIRAVGTDGVIRTVVGVGAEGFSGDGGPAVQAQIGDVYGLDVAPDGRIVFVEGYNHDANVGASCRVRLVHTDGTIQTLAGSGGCSEPWASPTGAPTRGSALGYGLLESTDVTFGADGDVYLLWTPEIWKVSAALPSFNATSYSIPSGDGSELFVFDAAGRHQQTVSTLTGAVLYEFLYSGNYLLSSIVDADGNTLMVERDINGSPTALIAPFGQRTELEMDDNGFLSEVTVPGGESVQMVYGPSGLLRQLVRPDGKIATYSYDARGRLTLADDGSGFVTELSRSAFEEGYEVTRTSGLGVVSTFRVESLPGGGTLLTNTDSAAAEVQVTLGADGTRAAAWPGGESDSQNMGPDPRFGALVPGSERFTASTPGGKILEVESWREVELGDPDDLLSLEKITEHRKIGTRVQTEVFDAASGAYTLTSPLGRVSTATVDATGRITSIDADPLLDVRFWTYDVHGQVSRVEQGSHFLEYEYDTLGRVVSRRDARNREQAFNYDSGDRVIGITLPSSRHYAFTYDAMGRMETITMPGGQLHELDYAPFGGLIGYTPPGADSLTQAYDIDRRRTEIGLPDGRSQMNTFDVLTRTDATIYPEATVGFTYQGVTHQFDVISWTPASGPPHSQSFTYDGDLLTATTLDLEGVSDTFVYSHDADWRLSGIQLNAEQMVAITYNDDDHPVSLGPFSIERNGPGGAPSRYTDGILAVDYEYDSLGRLSRRTHTLNANIAYELQLTHLAGSDLISNRIETVNGSPTTQAYEYTLDGELTSVTEGLVEVESYTYDANGNRSGADGVVATYDSQDRQQSRGPIAYVFDANGFLAARGGDSFIYSARGELLTATVGGETVNYTYDAVGRRVARNHNGAVTQYLYGDPINPFQVLASRDPNGVVTSYYYDQADILIGLERNGERYYIVTDQVGSPRLVVDDLGAVQREIVYSAFGEVIADVGAFELPIGFGGGIADPATGLVRFGFRDYEPASGRWTSRDPILFRGGQFNLYAYAHNNPVNLRDPSGLLCLGLSAYIGPGGGGKVCFKDGKWSLCAEVGLGAGGGLSLDLLGGAAPRSDANYVSAQISLGCGPAQLNVGSKIDNCGNLTITGGTQFSAGGFGFGNTRTRNLTTGTTKDTNFGLGPPGTGASINVSLLQVDCPGGCPNPLGASTQPVTDPDKKGKISCKAQAALKAGFCTGSDF